MSKLAILLVHGFWGGAAHWGKVIPELHKRGYTDLSAVENSLVTVAGDAARTQQMIAQQPGKVLLVGHSYGGAVITEAGNLPNVAGLVYIAAFAPDVGESLGEIGAAFPPPPGVRNAAPDSDGYVWIAKDKFHESFCQDVSEEDALVMAVTQKAPLAPMFGEKFSHAAWKTKPAWYQVSSEDRMIDPGNEARMAKRMGARKILTLPASHASLTSRPLEVAAFIDEAARSLG
jgi:pimeloyl-ACP methyl ester carboxylesterase